MKGPGHGARLMCMLRSPTVAETLQRFRSALVRRFGARLREMRLFGSWARGDAHAESDVDVFVAIDDLTPDERHEVFGLAYAADAENEWLVLLSPLVYSSTDAARMRSGGRRLFRDIDSEGVRL
jgi:predicted nucleotidyltransferase